MDNNLIQIIGIAISFILGLVSLIYAIKSHSAAKKANMIANEANEIAAKSLKISQDIQKEQKEFIELSSYKNVEILKNDHNIQYKGNPCWDAYLLIIPVEIKNKSSKPVSVKRPFFFWGQSGEYFYVDDNDFYNVEGYNQNVKFPCYMKEREMINIDIIIGISASDRLNFYSNKGITLSFEGTSNNYRKYFSSNTVIDNTKD